MTLAAPPTSKTITSRAQHRLTTNRDIADAALELFEQQGIHNTTVEQIALSARVSARTFYRYAQTKENAVFIDDTTMDVVLERVEAAEHSVPAVMKVIEQEQLNFLDTFDSGTPEAHARFLRIRQLIFTEPTLLSRALMREENHIQELTSLALRAGPSSDLDELRARTIITAIGTAIRLSFDEWARNAERGHKTRTRAHYAQIRGGLAAYFSVENPT